MNNYSHLIRNLLSYVSIVERSKLIIRTFARIFTFLEFQCCDENFSPNNFISTFKSQNRENNSIKNKTLKAVWQILFGSFPFIGKMVFPICSCMKKEQKKREKTKNKRSLSLNYF